MGDLFESITNIVTSAIQHDWVNMGAAIVATVQHGVELIAKLFGLGQECNLQKNLLITPTGELGK